MPARREYLRPWLRVYEHEQGFEGYCDVCLMGRQNKRRQPVRRWVHHHMFCGFFDPGEAHLVSGLIPIAQAVAPGA